MARQWLAILYVSVLIGCGSSETSTNESNAAPANEVTPATPAEPAALDVKIKSLKFAKAVNKDQKIEAHTVAFSPLDTIYASVELAGKGNAHLKAVWTHTNGDKLDVVNESEQSVEVNGEAATAFHVTPPSGWPTGDYKVEVKLNDTFSEAKNFSVSE